jgi:hypothetical protein
MSTESRLSHTRTDPRATGQRSPDLLTTSQAQERADIEEDRRQQQELDQAELGGEA